MICTSCNRFNGGGLVYNHFGGFGDSHNCFGGSYIDCMHFDEPLMSPLVSNGEP